MGIEDNREEEEEGDEHVDDGEDAVDAGLRVEIGEVVDGGDEGVPWEEEAEAEGEEDDVSEVEGVRGDLGGGAAGDGEEEG